MGNQYTRVNENSFPPSKVPKKILLAGILALSLISSGGGHETGGHGDSPPPHWPYHALLVSMGLISMAAGMLVARHKKGRRWWLKAHKTLALSGAFLATLGFLVAAYLVSTYLETYFVKEVHSYIGIGAVMLVVATPLIGFMQFRLRDKRMRVAHKWLGRMTITLVSANIIAGLQMILR